ncbi:Rv3235 family protein [Pseudonocardia kunmingensis]|uniref:Uncharacterized protein n=1 Tax=Pseudonocardia kunmingensis TaxID=630975 RepID=A0A543CX43_9PSEU|nr:Rv3235 family protein [Pseudonocardia kunmingensis]TQM01683.1 hypothetical protein FB558_8584 [Pseudonocardia kunmingensis]
MGERETTTFRIRRYNYEPPPGPHPTPPQQRSAAPAAPQPDPSTAWARDPQLRKTVAMVLAAALEVIDTRRPSAHLREHVTPPVLRYIRAARLLTPPARPSRMRPSVHMFCPTDEAAEVATTVMIGPRIRAVAARFERAIDGWSCVQLRIL